MREERVQTIEAHQSRVKQLQDKYQEMLKEAAENASSNSATKEIDQETLVTFQSKFEAEKIELLTVQKANFQKTRIVMLELKATAEKPVQQDPSTTARVRDLESEIMRKDAEIGFLKETVKMECEERMELLATVDSLQRGFTKSGTVGGVKSNSKAAEYETVPSQEQLESSMPQVLVPPTEKAPSQYQKLMAMANLKKEKNLKSAAKKNNMG
ncbi:UNVERIFIED_CONTAM: hypothetical protein HDU68_011970 [Siphonaria sp. JEL0065]|nr:hypothetical protein HDU68_011970 [Siphonaria sp. JEL0065]